MAIDFVPTPAGTAGLLSARPAAGVVGRTYFATDTNQSFVDTGAAWLEVGAAAPYYPRFLSMGA